jgi:hypothetical protein
LSNFDLSTAIEEQLRMIPVQAVPPALIWWSSEHEGKHKQDIPDNNDSRSQD